jgi:hypothetical protein
MTAAPASLPDVPHPFCDDSARLSAEIAELSAYIHAATYRLLTLIREFDEKEYWGLPGLCSCAHWLNFQCGIGMNAAREKVRVAHALKDLPLISEAFRRGELSYSKVRAMTRIADASNEDYLLMIARHSTAHHVEKLVSKYRRCKRLQNPDNTERQHEKRELYFGFDDDGSIVIRGRLPAEQGALVMKALELAMDRADSAAEDIALETSGREPFHARRADALAGIAESYLNGEPGDNATADRYQVVLHVTAETLDPVQTTPTPAARASHLDGGPHITAETSRRIACDASIVRLGEDAVGEPLSIGRKSRTIPPAIRRALRARDDGCRFPGCTHRSFLDGHHIDHWADGGETGLDNLVQLCRRHHRLVHEGGFQCSRDENGNLQFRDPRERLLNRYAVPTPVPDDATIEDWMVSHMQDVAIEADTCVPNWMAGDTMDWDLAAGNLFLA